MNIKKLLTLAVLVMSFASYLSINAMRRCQGNQCPRQQGQQKQGGHHPHREHPHHHEHQHHPQAKPDVLSYSATAIQVKENDKPVTYNNTDKPCPTGKHRHDHPHRQTQGRWQGHQHEHGHQHGPRVRYQYNNGAHVDGVLNVTDESGNCSVYTRAGTSMTPEELERILEESLEVE